MASDPAVRRLRLAAVACLLLFGCTGAPPGGSDGAGAELTVFAAASLSEAVSVLESSYRREHPGFRLVVSLDASSALRAQIEQGAPADLFLGADIEHAQRLADAGLASSPQRFAGNRLVIVVPASNGGRVDTAADLGVPGVRIVAAGPEVPITRYSEELLRRLAALPDLPDGLPARYAANVVSREDNVRAALAKVELGEGDAAIVYLTDARQSRQVRTIEVPGIAPVTAVYAGAVIVRSRYATEAQQFLDWVVGPSGSAALAGLGFSRP